MTRASTQTRLDAALTRLLAGQPTATDGSLTVANLCREAGVGRDSYYRSPQQFKDRFVAACGNHDGHQPELVRLREVVAELRRQQKRTVTGHAAAVRDLEDTIKTYANQIQALALRSAELGDENLLLRQRHGQSANVVLLPTEAPGRMR